MYYGLRDAVAEFSTNLFALLNHLTLVALFVWAWLLTIAWYPIAEAAAAIARGSTVPPVSIATIAIAGGIWLLASLRFGLPWHLFLLNPAILTVSVFVGVRAMLLALTGLGYWKGRRLAARKPRLI
ncbi:hypothetical protein FJY68_03015 [candidate division WOR-3 bacterium]|uniref:Uncharacterized protein n=1 Tax=candidate division WOR-3 bacterium TaxID=2052148 RepID=A0A938BSQ3_UNCW3|nr:hypothetical protein [candidate division WOR-3 bacterium]